MPTILWWAFEHRADAERFLQEFRERLAKFGLELHPEKTRLIEFGRFAVRDRKRRGEGKPETFTFLGFTHYCGQLTSSGAFNVWRDTAKKRMGAKLQAIKAELRRRKHRSVRARSASGCGRLCRAITNTTRCRATLVSCASSGVASAGCGGSVLVRRSQRAQVRWERLDPSAGPVDSPTPRSASLSR